MSSKNYDKKITKDDRWILKQNLQGEMNSLLRKYEAKGIEVQSIQIVKFPLNKPNVRINLGE